MKKLIIPLMLLLAIPMAGNAQDLTSLKAQAKKAVVEKGKTIAKEKVNKAADKAADKITKKISKKAGAAAAEKSKSTIEAAKSKVKTKAADVISAKADQLVK